MIHMERENASPVHSFDWTAFESPSHAVVMAVTGESDADPVEIEPINTAIDADALDSIFLPTFSSQRPPNSRIQFDYLGYRIVLNAHGRGYLYERDDQSLLEAEAR